MLCRSDQLRPTWTFSIVSIQRARWIIGSCSANVSWKWLKIFQLCHQNYKRRFLSLSVGKSDLTPWASNHFWATEHPVSDDWNHSWPRWFIWICIQPAFSLSRGPSLCMATRIDNWTNKAWTIIFARPRHQVPGKHTELPSAWKFRIYKIKCLLKSVIFERSWKIIPEYFGGLHFHLQWRNKQNELSAQGGPFFKLHEFESSSWDAVLNVAQSP